MKVRCSSCMKVVSGRAPQGGDGAETWPWRHDHNGDICIGSYQAAQVLEKENTALDSELLD